MTTKQLTKAGLIKFLKHKFEPYGETVGTTFKREDGSYNTIVVESFKEAEKRSNYAGGKWSVFYEGSTMYEMLNYGEDDWKFHTELIEFLEEYGLWFELGYSWHINIYQD